MALVPEQLDMNDRQIKRQWSHHQLRDDAGRGDEMPGHDREQIGLRDHLAGREELIEREHHPPAATERRQRLVDETEGAARKADQQMPRRAEGIRSRGADASG